MESISLKTVIESMDLVINKADKGNTGAIPESTKYLQGIKSVLSDSSKFMKLSIDENKWINYIINLENKLNNCFKVLKNVGKSSEKEFGSIC